MQATVRVLSRPHVGAGFGLAGLENVDVSTAADGALALRRLLDDPSIGVVLMEQELHDALPDDIRHLIGRRPLPMVVPFPGPSWTGQPTEAEAWIVELLRQVIGYRVRLR